MTLVKVLKNKAYFKRFQVKNRRRRECKTDYAQRRALVKQDKNKYNTPKYRLVVRTTNTKIVCQVIYATIEGDKIVCQADSTELTRYGIPAGLKNYSAAYCTGLLIARRVLKQLKMDSAIAGNKKINGEEYHVADEECERRPFKCVLDVGLTRTTVGNRVFGALKGAADGGLDIPHNTKRFPGYTVDEGKEGKYSAETHRDRIFGKHVADYMRQMKDEEPEEYEKHFSAFIKAGITSDKIEGMYKKAHDKIRANPDAARKVKSTKKNIRKGNKITTPGGKSYERKVRITLEERKARVMNRIRAAQEKAAENAEEEE